MLSSKILAMLVLMLWCSLSVERIHDYLSSGVSMPMASEVSPDKADLFTFNNFRH